MDILPDLDSLSAPEREALVARLEQREHELSVLRRRYHERIDALRAVREERVRARLATGSEGRSAGESVPRLLFRGTGELVDRDLDALPVAASLDDAALTILIRALEAEEDDVSFARRETQGHLDIVRAHRRGDPVDLASLPAVLTAPRPAKTGAR